MNTREHTHTHTWTGSSSRSHVAAAQAPTCSSFFYAWRRGTPEIGRGGRLGSQNILGSGNVWVWRSDSVLHNPNDQMDEVTSFIRLPTPLYLEEGGALWADVDWPWGVGG